jgi:hypothetical protein
MPSLAELVTSQAVKADIKDVPPLPAGTYLAIIVGPHTMVKSKEKQTDGIEFNYRLVSASEDVNEEELRVHLDARGGSVHDITGKHTIWESTFAQQSLRDFVYDALGVDADLGMQEALGDVPGRNFYIHFRHTPFKRQTGEMALRAEIDKTFAA